MITRKIFSSTLLLLLLLPACRSTYERDRIAQHIQELALSEYGAVVQVVEVGETVGVQMEMADLFTHIMAADQAVWKKMEEMIMVLSRVALSSDRPPQFVVLDVADAGNPHARMLFTRAVVDLRKIMAQALSRNQYLDRLLIEFDINGRRMAFDLHDTDLVRLIMLASEALLPPSEDLAEGAVVFREVEMTEFLAKVAANTLRRQLRDGKDARGFAVREVSARFEAAAARGATFHVWLDLVAKPGATVAQQALEKRILPFVAKEVAGVLRSYGFTQAAHIAVIEKNSGRLTITPVR